MLTSKERELLSVFMVFYPREQKAIYQLLKSNTFTGSFTDFGELIDEDSSNVRKLLMSMWEKGYIEIEKRYSSYYVIQLSNDVKSMFDCLND